MKYMQREQFSLSRRILSGVTAFVFLFSSLMLSRPGYAQEGVLNLPVPGTMVTPTQAFHPPIIAGMTLYSENPLKFDFIMDIGDESLKGEALANESKKLINYFLATLTVPEDEMWVNLSPYEKDRIIADGLSQTEMGRDMLAQDYLLKQLTASLMYPENELGKKFWDRVYKKAYAQYGTTEIPMNTFNKIWIVPEKAVVYVQGKNVFIVENRLKVMLEEDYLASRSNSPERTKTKGSQDISTEIIREVLLPEIEKEVNTGRNFSNLRQIYNSMLLATWYKKNLKESFLGEVYSEKNKVKGIDLKDRTVKQKIYEQYMEAFKKGVYNYIKEDVHPVTRENIPRKYFSGGLEDYQDGTATRFTETSGNASAGLIRLAQRPYVKVNVQGQVLGVDASSPVDSIKTKILYDDAGRSFGKEIRTDTFNATFHFATKIFDSLDDFMTVYNLGIDEKDKERLAGSLNKIKGPLQSVIQHGDKVFLGKLLNKVGLVDLNNPEIDLDLFKDDLETKSELVKTDILDKTSEVISREFVEILQTALRGKDRQDLRFGDFDSLMIFVEHAYEHQRADRYFGQGYFSSFVDFLEHFRETLSILDQFYNSVNAKLDNALAFQVATYEGGEKHPRLFGSQSSIESKLANKGIIKKNQLMDPAMFQLLRIAAEEKLVMQEGARKVYRKLKDPLVAKRLSERIKGAIDRAMEDYGSSNDVDAINKKLFLNLILVVNEELNQFSGFDTLRVPQEDSWTFGDLDGFPELSDPQFEWFRKPLTMMKLLRKGNQLVYIPQYRPGSAELLLEEIGEFIAEKYGINMGQMVFKGSAFYISGLFDYFNRFLGSVKVGLLNKEESQFNGEAELNNYENILRRIIEDAASSKEERNLFLRVSLVDLGQPNPDLDIFKSNENMLSELQNRGFLEEDGLINKDLVQLLQLAMKGEFYTINAQYREGVNELKQIGNLSVGQEGTLIKAKDSSSPVDQKYGGIDFNPKNLDLKQHGENIRFTIPAEYMNINPGSVEGIAPVIINITPVPSLMLLLGLSDQPQQNEPQNLDVAALEKS